MHEQSFVTNQCKHLLNCSDKLKSRSGESLVVGRHGLEVAVLSKHALGARELSPSRGVEDDPGRTHCLVLGDEIVLVHSFYNHAINYHIGG